MRSNELRDDGASLTTLEDFAPMVLCFYGICVLATVHWCSLRDLSQICLLATVQLSVAPEARMLRMLCAQQVETLAMLRAALKGNASS